MQQVKELYKEYDDMQLKYGDSSLNSIYGAGDINNPDIMFIFMNPTGRNIASTKDWNGLRAPWIGTKQVWDIFYDLDLLDSDIYTRIKSFKPLDWDISFTNEVYSNIENSSVYITNLAKCTQLDARPLSNILFKEYLDLMFKEIEIVNPKRIITFGNQVSSILLNMPISVSNYINDEYEVINIDKEYYVYPTYYPVGQGRRNMPLAIDRIKRVFSVNSIR